MSLLLAHAVDERRQLHAPGYRTPHVEHRCLLRTERTHLQVHANQLEARLAQALREAMQELNRGRPRWRLEHQELHEPGEHTADVFELPRHFHCPLDLHGSAATV